MVGGARVLGHLEGGHLADLGQLPGQGERGGVRPGDRGGRAGQVRLEIGNRLQWMEGERRDPALGGRRQRLEAGRAAGVAEEAKQRSERGDLLAGGDDLRVGYAEQHDLGIRTCGFDLVAAGQPNLARSGAEGAAERIAHATGTDDGGRGEGGGVGA